MKVCEVCRCNGSLTIEVGPDESPEKAPSELINERLNEWRALHVNCERSPQALDHSGSTYAGTSFGFAPRDWSRPVVK